MTVPRVLFQGGPGTVLRVSLPGWDVTTADIDHLVFNSSFSGLSIVQRGSTTCSIRGSKFVGWTVAQDKIPWVLFRANFPPDTRYFGPYIYKGLKGANDYIMGTASTSGITFEIQELGVDIGATIDYVAFKNVDPT